MNLFAQTVRVWATSSIFTGSHKAFWASDRSSSVLLNTSEGIWERNVACVQKQALENLSICKHTKHGCSSEPPSAPTKRNSLPLCTPAMHPTYDVISFAPWARFQPLSPSFFCYHDEGTEGEKANSSGDRKLPTRPHKIRKAVHVFIFQISWVLLLNTKALEAGHALSY